MTARNPQLDGFRALAISLVLVAHSIHTAPHSTFEEGRAAIGEVGVDIFFVLSGYLITTLLMAERERTGLVDVAAFYVRRARRILPAFYAFLTFVGIVAAAIGMFGTVAPEIARDALFLRDYHVASSSWLDHTWSLAVETQFYLIWPAAFLFLGNRRAKYAALGVAALDPLIRLVSYEAFPASRDLMTVAFHTRVDMLMFGCALALIMEHGAPLWLRRATATFARPAFCAFVLVACIAATAVLHGAFAFIIGMSIEGIAIALMLAGAIEYPQTAFARLLASSPATWLGRISYSLYLWQQPFLYPLNDSILGRFPANIVFALGAACLSYYFVERAFFQPKPVPVTA